MECLSAFITYQYIITFLYWKNFKQVKYSCHFSHRTLNHWAQCLHRICIEEIHGTRLYGSFFFFFFKDSLAALYSWKNLSELWERMWLKKCVRLNLPKLIFLHYVWQKKKNRGPYIEKWCTYILGNIKQYTWWHLKPQDKHVLLSGVDFIINSTPQPHPPPRGKNIFTDH